MSGTDAGRKGRSAAMESGIPVFKCPLRCVTLGSLAQPSVLHPLICPMGTKIFTPGSYVKIQLHKVKKFPAHQQTYVSPGGK